MEAVIYLDTHVLMWLHSGDLAFMSPKARELMDQHEVLISPMVLLELQYLSESKRLHLPPHQLVENLSNEMGLKVCEKLFLRVVHEASQHRWTRDPFDRLITAHAALDKNVLITKDEIIRRHYARAVW